MMLDMEIAYTVPCLVPLMGFFLLNCRCEQVYHNEAINAKHIDQTIFEREIAYKTNFITANGFSLSLLNCRCKRVYHDEAV